MLYFRRNILFCHDRSSIQVKSEVGVISLSQLQFIAKNSDNEPY